MAYQLDGIRFLIIGTSKSQNTENYYVQERLKMWGVIHLSGWMLSYWKSEEEYMRLGGNKYAQSLGFQFVDLSKSLNSKDTTIDYEQEFNHIKSMGLLISKSSAEFLLFNGKTALLFFIASQFLETYDFQEIAQLNKFKKKFNYGRIDLKNYLRDDHPAYYKIVYLLPNTSSRTNHFNEFTWISVLKKIKYGN